MGCWSGGVLGCTDALARLFPSPDSVTPLLQRSITPTLCFSPSMPKYNYVAMDQHGKETRGTLEVGTQNEAIGRVKEMGLFPTKIVEIDKEAKGKGTDKKAPGRKSPVKGKKKGGGGIQIKIP